MRAPSPSLIIIITIIILCSFPSLSPLPMLNSKCCKGGNKKKKKKRERARQLLSRERGRESRQTRTNAFRSKKNENKENWIQSQRGEKKERGEGGKEKESNPIDRKRGVDFAFHLNICVV